MKSRRVTGAELQRKYRQNPAMRRATALDDANVRLGAAHMKAIYDALHPGDIKFVDQIQKVPKQQIRETNFGPMGHPIYKLKSMFV